MDKEISICQIISLMKKVDITIMAKHTFLNSKLVCSFFHNDTVIFTFISNHIDLFEGAQSFIINHNFSDLCFNNVTLIIEIFDQSGIRQCIYEKSLQQEDEPYSKFPVMVTGDLVRKSEGGIITIGIGGVVYRIHSLYDQVLYQCKDYLTTNDPDEEITITLDDINNEKNELKRVLRRSPKDPEIEMYAVRRKVSESILDYNGFQIHGAAVAIDNQGYIFTADSGTGKTTHIKLWLSNHPNAYVVNGDHPIVKIEKNIMVYGSPWCGKEGMNTNAAVCLKAIVLMERSKENSIAEISMNEALVELIRQIYKPLDTIKMKKTLQLLSSLNGKVKFYKFKFNNFAEDAFSISYGTIHIEE